MIAIGIAGQLAWYFYGGVACPVSGGQPYLYSTPCDTNATAASFQEMQNVSGLMMLIGFILLPAGLFKDGLPSPGTGAKVFIGVILFLAVSATFTGIVISPHSGPTLVPNGFITILSGSGNNVGAVITFSPKVAVLIIGTNNTVQWSNNDSSAHTVTADGNSSIQFNSDNLNSGASFTFAFNTPGTYTYHCNYHNWMHGTIIVEAAKS